jgi:nucleoside-diphosphate-sugar epimerase
MRVLVCGSSGCIGSAVVRALRWRGHRVVETRRLVRADEADAIALDFLRPASVDDWATRLAALDVDAIVNCAGTALPGPASASADRLHGDGPLALFRGAERAHVARIVNVSALEVDDKPGRSDDGWRTRHATDAALLRLAVDAVVVRPSLVYGPRSRSAAALASLARAPIAIVPGGGHSMLQPIHVFELAESIAALVERTGAARGVYELGGANVVSCGALLAALCIAQGAPAPLAPALPMSVARIAARLKRVAWRGPAGADVLRLLEHVGVTHRNAAEVLLGRAPSTLAEGLLVTPPSCAPAVKPSRAHGTRWLHHSRGVL